jgi:hypothetical protein
MTVRRNTMENFTIGIRVAEANARDTSTSMGGWMRYMWNALSDRFFSKVP